MKLDYCIGGVMNSIEARSERQAVSMDRDESRQRRETRRKILGWLGLGAIGAVIFKLSPMEKTVARKLARKTDEKISISINEHAVKRNKKVARDV